MSSRALIITSTVIVMTAALSGCTPSTDPLEVSLACLQERGVDAEIKDGALVVTQLANNASDVDVDAAVAECGPEDLQR